MPIKIMTTYLTSDLKRTPKSIEESLRFDSLGTEIFFDNDNAVFFGLSFQKINEKDWFYEIGLTRLAVYKRRYLRSRIFSNNLSQPTQGNETKAIEIATRFEYGKYLSNYRKSQWNLAVSLGVTPFYYKNEFIAATSAAFPIIAHTIGSSFDLIPTLVYNPKPSISFILKLVPSIFDFSYQRRRVRNPILTERQQREQKWVADAAFEDISLSLGLQYQFTR